MWVCADSLQHYHVLENLEPNPSTCICTSGTFDWLGKPAAPACMHACTPNV